MHFELSYIKSCNSFGFVVWITKFQCDAWIVKVDLKYLWIWYNQLIEKYPILNNMYVFQSIKFLLLLKLSLK